MTSIEAYILVLKEQKRGYVSYLQQKIVEEDWHAISDAANDLREIEAKIEVLNEVKSETRNT